MNYEATRDALYAHGLPGSALRLPSEPLDDQSLTELLSIASDRAVGHILAAIDDGALVVTPAQRELVVGRVTDRCVADLRLERALLEAVGTLESVGVAARIIKGAAAAHLDDDRPWRRPFGDVDLLVRGEDFDTAAGALLVAGLSRRHPELRPGFDRRFTKAACFVRGDRIEIDMHRTFTMGAYGLAVVVDDLWSGSETFELGGCTVHTLTAENRFLHACYHGVLGDKRPRLHTLRDVALLTLRRGLDIDLLDERTAAWKGAAVVSSMVAATWRRFALSDNPIAEWARRLPVTDEDRRALHSYDAVDGGRFASTSIAAVRWLPWRDRPAFVRALVQPSRAYLSTAGRTPGDRIRRAVRSVLNREDSSPDQA